MKSHKKYTPEEDKTILEQYPWQDIEILARELGRTPPAIHGHAFTLGVHCLPMQIARRIQLEHQYALTS